MGKVRDLSPHKVGQISVLFHETTLKRKQIAKRLSVSIQTISNIKKKLKNGHSLASNRVGKCGRSKKTMQRMDRKVIEMAIKDRRASFRIISNELAAENITIARRTLSKRLLEGGVKAYRRRKMSLLTDKMKQARKDWEKVRVDWTCE